MKQHQIRLLPFPSIVCLLSLSILSLLPSKDTYLTLVDESPSVRREIDDSLHLDLPHRLVDILHLLRDAVRVEGHGVPMYNVIRQSI